MNETTMNYWECECDDLHYIHPDWHANCLNCHTIRAEMPDARVNEVLATFDWLETVDKYTTDDVANGELSMAQVLLTDMVQSPVRVYSQAQVTS